ncbi:LuxR C-terminal-related transcriptional regulator [Algiphilus aromaticivorans]|uniref:LuxR C-terminal-related transcriptional regulator n=1 Tax=Algiphilus aromaticivorans TaxID=382454 RepID=UPI0005C13D83|nr:LuxR C-terminal-related transcriptional regulator [Algiphilus aromaticivorans]
MIRTLDHAFRPQAQASLEAAPRRVRGQKHDKNYTYILEWLDQLASNDEPVILVFDDYEVVNDAAVHELLDNLIKSYIPNVHTIVLSRGVPPLSLSALRHRQQLYEIGRRELAFTKDEIEVFLNRQYSIEVTPRNLEVIEARTEGWPVAVQLVGLVLSHRSDATGFIEGLSGSDVDVADFLSAEVLSRQSPDITDFLLRISPLSRVSAELCVAVIGSPHAPKLLDCAVRSNLLLFPVDRNNTWFRFHPLFREFLEGQLLQHPEISRDKILRAAMSWCKQNDLPADAINYALELTDSTQAAQLVTEYAERFVYTTGDHSLFLAWMEQLKSYPKKYAFDLRYWQAWALTISHRTRDAERALKDIEKSYARESPRNQTRMRRARIEIIRILLYVFTDRWVDCINAATEWLAIYQDDDAFDTCSIATALAAASCTTGEFAMGRSALQTARYAVEAAHSPYAESWVGVIEGHLAMSLGDFRVARSVLMHQFECTSRALGYSSSALSTVSLLLAGACYELGDLEHAKKYLKFGLPHINDHGLIESAASGFRVMIRTREKSDGLEAALEAYRDCERHSRAYGARLALMLMNEYVCLVLRHARVDKAVEETGFDGNSFASDYFVAREGEDELCGLVRALISARVLIASNQSESALRVLSPALATASRTNRRAYKVELLILRSRAEYVEGNDQRARRTLLEAMTEAAPLGMTQVFLDEGAELRPLLDPVMPMFAQLPDASESFINAMRAFSASAKRKDGNRSSSSCVPEELSSREVQILQLLESGLTNEEVASRLFLSPKTIKWHLYNAYQKLGVKNRTGALAKAREGGMV